MNKGAFQSSIRISDVKRTPWTHHHGSISGLALSFDGKLAAVALQDDTIQMWDLCRQQLDAKLLGHSDAESYNLVDKGLTGWDGWVQVRVDFSPDARLLATGSTNSTIRMWNTLNREEVWKVRLDERCADTALAGYESRVFGVRFSPDGELLATIVGPHTVTIRNARNGERKRDLTVSDYYIESIAFAPNCKTLAIAGGIGLGKIKPGEQTFGVVELWTL